MICLRLPGRKRRDRLEDLIGKPADVQDVLALRGLRCAVRLNVQTYEPGLRVPVTESVLLLTYRKSQFV